MKKLSLGLFFGIALIATLGYTGSTALKWYDGRYVDSVVDFVNTTPPMINGAAIATQTQAAGLVATHNADSVSSHADIRSTLAGKANTADLGTAATLNVGSAANNLVQLDSSAKLPAVDGSQLTNVAGNGNAIKIQGVDVDSTTPNSGQLLKYDGSKWIPSTVSSSGDVTGPSSAVAGNLPKFGGTTGKEILDSGVSADSMSGHLSNTSNPHNVTAAQTGAIAATALDADNALAADSDSKVPSQKAVKYYVDNHAGGSTFAGLTGDPTDNATLAEYLPETPSSSFASTDHEKFVIASYTGVAAGIDANTKLCMHFENNLTDSSSSANTITGTDVTYGTGNYAKFGTYAASFNGSSSYAYYTPAAFTSGSWTICWWEYRASSSDQVTSIGNNDAGNGMLLNYHDAGNSVSKIYLYYNDASSGSFTFYNTTPKTGAFHHFAVVLDGTNLYGYVDGVRTLSTTISKTVADFTQLNIGRWKSSGGYMSGYIDELRISNVARWTGASFTVPASAYSSDSTLVRKYTLSENALGTVAINAQTGTSYTLVLADAGKIVTMSSGSANTLTIPLNSSVAFAVGTVISVDQLGAGVTTVTAASGVTLNGTDAKSVAITGQYLGVVLKKLATNTWIAQGGI